MTSSEKGERLARLVELINTATRPLVTIMLVGGLLLGFQQGKIADEQFFTVVTMVVGFWFGQRTAEKAAAPTQEPVQQQAKQAPDA